MWVRSLGQEDPLEEGMATHSSILVWKSHGQRSLAGYSPQGSQRVRRDLGTKQQLIPYSQPIPPILTSPLATKVCSVFSGLFPFHR